MSRAKKLALIAAGYALAIAGGVGAVVINELLTPDDIAQSSGGMDAFGDMILFVLVVGVFGLTPTWFLLKMCVQKAPRALLAVLLLLAAIGPVSWLTIVHLNGASAPSLPQAEWLGPLISFGAMPRIVVGPILVVVEGLVFCLAKDRVARALLGAAMLMDLVPLGEFALHLFGAIRR
jgi:hypothetical protein